MYKNYNANPKNKKIGDCVIRAFSLASGKSWDNVYKDLCEIGFKIKAMPNDKVTYTKYASDLGFTDCPIELINRHKPTVSEFGKIHPIGIFVLRVANHLVTVVNGDYYDIWDCGNKSVYKYWKANK